MILFFCLCWIFPAFFIAFVFGVARKIGFWGSFLISLVLTPIVGFIVTLCSKTIEKEKREKQMIEIQKQQLEAIKAQKQLLPSVADQLKILGELKEKGEITQDEYQKAKNKLLS